MERGVTAKRQPLQRRWRRHGLHHDRRTTGQDCPGKSGDIEVRDRNGNHLGYVTRSFTPEEIEEAKRGLASSGPWYTTQQVLDHLRSLEPNDALHGRLAPVGARPIGAALARFTGSRSHFGRCECNRSRISRGPLAKGVPVAPGLFELTALPLRVLYEVSEPDRLAKVAGVKLA
jgi:hypothetical protein